MPKQTKKAGNWKLKQKTNVPKPILKILFIYAQASAWSTSAAGLGFFLTIPSYLKNTPPFEKPGKQK